LFIFLTRWFDRITYIIWRLSEKYEASTSHEAKLLISVQKLFPGVMIEKLKFNLTWSVSISCYQYIEENFNKVFEIVTNLICCRRRMKYAESI
jgi:hypothetical protein